MSPSSVFSQFSIANGRKLGDLQGNFTCNDCKALQPTVIDYIIAEEDIFNDILCMTVNPLTDMSDHCNIDFKLKCNFTKMTSPAKQQKIALNSKDCLTQANMFLEKNMT